MGMIGLVSFLIVAGLLWKKYCYASISLNIDEPGAASKGKNKNTGYDEFEKDEWSNLVHHAPIMNRESKIKF